MDAVGRVLVLTLAALFTGTVILLGQSAFWPDSVSVWIVAVLVALAIFAFSQPRSGLLVVAGLAPLANVGSQLFTPSMRGAEALVLACLTGALVRAWWSGRIRRFPSGRIEMAVLVFGLIVAASCIEQLWFSQMQGNFPWPFLQQLGLHASRDYLVRFGGFLMIFNAMLFLEGLALLVWSMDCCRREPAFASRLLGVIIISAACAAILNISHAATQFAESRQPMDTLFAFVGRQRWTAHVDDFNAAASFFAMCFFVALGCAWIYRKAAFAWLAASLLIGAAFWMAQSRTAFAAALVVVAVVIATVACARFASRLRALAVTALVTAPLGILALWYIAMSRTDPASAIGIRWMFLRTTLSMLQWQPIFGVGIGQYSLWSQHFEPPELLIHHLENAHDNFAQVAGELGVVGLVAFLFLLASALWHWKRASRTNPIAQTAFVGLGAFILSWLGGHPLLVPEVAYPFWIVLGAVAGLSFVPTAHPRSSAVDVPPAASASSFFARPRLRPAVLGGLVLVLLAISLPSRLTDKARVLDWTRISYGFYGWEVGPQGDRFRWTSARARFFIPANVTRFTMPLRAFSVTSTNPIVVNLLVDDRLANQFRMPDPAWRMVDVMIPRRPTRNYTQIDLQVNRTWVPSHDNPESSDSRQLGVQVGEPAVRSLRDPSTRALN